jgi:hypothetical protein
MPVDPQPPRRPKRTSRVKASRRRKPKPYESPTAPRDYIERQRAALGG